MTLEFILGVTFLAAAIAGGMFVLASLGPAGRTAMRPRRRHAEPRRSYERRIVLEGGLGFLAFVAWLAIVSTAVPA